MDRRAFVVFAAPRDVPKRGDESEADKDHGRVVR